MSTPLDPAVKKAYETSYALFRVAAILPSRSFAQTLENEALNLLRFTAGNLPEEARNTLNAIHYLVAFGKDTGNIHIENTNLLIQQIELLASLLHDRANNAITPADIDHIFSGDVSSVAESRVAEPAIAGSRPAEYEHKAKELPKHSSVPATPLSDRQDTILNTIRQSGNCRARDIQAVLPDLSERTLRYDLQRLIEDGKIERGGGGGPASWYKIKSNNPQSNVSGGVSL